MRLFFSVVTEVVLVAVDFVVVVVVVVVVDDDDDDAAAVYVIDSLPILFCGSGSMTIQFIYLMLIVTESIYFQDAKAFNVGLAACDSA